MAGSPKTHCINGHEYTPENTLFWVKKSLGNRRYRVCRTCKNISDKLYDVYKRKQPATK